MGCELGYGIGPVAYFVFYIVAQFGEGLVVACGLEDGVVAEAFASSALTDYLAFYDTGAGSEKSFITRAMTVRKRALRLSFPCNSFNNVVMFASES